MHGLPLRVLALAGLVGALVFVGACDQTDPAPSRLVEVRYQVGPSGQFGAQHAAFIEFTGEDGQTVRQENVALPFMADVEIATGTEVTLTAEVQAPANQSGLQIAIRADGTLLASDAQGGFDGTSTVTNTLSLTATLP